MTIFSFIFYANNINVACRQFIVMHALSNFPVHILVTSNTINVKKIIIQCFKGLYCGIVQYALNTPIESMHTYKMIDMKYRKACNCSTLGIMNST